MKNVTRYVSDYVYESINENGNAIQIDMRGLEDKNGQSPMELVLSAVSGCAIVDIVLMLKKKRKTILDISVETSGIRDEDHPRKFNKVHSLYKLQSPDTTTEELTKIAKLTLDKYCSVASSLNVKIEFSVEITDK